MSVGGNAGLVLVPVQVVVVFARARLANCIVHAACALGLEYDRPGDVYST